MRWWIIMAGWTVAAVGVVAWLYVQVRKEEKDQEWEDRLREAESFDYEYDDTPPRAA